MIIVVDFVDKTVMPEKLGDGQSIVDFDGRQVIRTERNDGTFGGAFVKLNIKETDIQYISCTMNEQELKKYVTTKVAAMIH